MKETNVTKDYKLYTVKGNVENLVGTANTEEAALRIGAEYFEKMCEGEGILVCYLDKYVNGKPVVHAGRNVFYVWH